jgi:hypothetical protein
MEPPWTALGGSMALLLGNPEAEESGWVWSSPKSVLSSRRLVCKKSFKRLNSFVTSGATT